MGSQVISILVVDDSETTRESLCAHLRLLSRQDRRVSVTTAASLEEARWALPTTDPISRFDAVVLDLRLPNGSGVQLIQEIRQMVGCIPLIIYTSLRDHPLDDYFAAGADDYLDKKADIHQIEATVLAAAKRSNSRRNHHVAWRTMREAVCEVESSADKLLSHARRASAAMLTVSVDEGV